MPLRRVLIQNRHDVALVIGNGINRYGEAGQTNSWDGLLLSLATKHKILVAEKIPDGITLTEFYDLLELGRPTQASHPISLQKEFCAGMEEWRFFPHHERIVRWARQNAAPILTTNFDSILSRAGSCRLLPERSPKFTDYYPWDRYYGDAPLQRPDLGFAIWHINGMQKYRRSIRLGLTHYMGSVERVRSWIHKGDERRLFGGKDMHHWVGADTWLHVIFNKPLVIIGLGLEENEVFLRWLLIERARYFRKYQERRRAGWYVYSSDKEKDGKLYFLKGLGIEPIKVRGYDDIYGEATW